MYNRIRADITKTGCSAESICGIHLRKKRHARSVIQTPQSSKKQADPGVGCGPGVRPTTRPWSIFESMERRHFLMGSLAAATSPRRAGASPNDTIRVACVGVHAQGRTHIRRYSAMQNVEIAAICDVDESVLNARIDELEKSGKKRPAAFTDLRKLLEDKSIDAISIATPNHNHTLQTVWACQAGKHVYVEKPCSHDMFEARQIVAAAQKYKRMVQHGTQQRSAVGREAVQKMREGLIGDVFMARGLCYKRRDTIRRKHV